MKQKLYTYIPFGQLKITSTWFSGLLSSTSIEDGLTSLAEPQTSNATSSRKRRSVETKTFAYNRVSVRNGARFALRGDFVNLDSRYLMSGDKTAWLHVRSGQTVFVGG